MTKTTCKIEPFKVFIQIGKITNNPKHETHIEQKTYAVLTAGCNAATEMGYYGLLHGFGLLPSEADYVVYFFDSEQNVHGSCGLSEAGLTKALPFLKMFDGEIGEDTPKAFQEALMEEKNE